MHTRKEIHSYFIHKGARLNYLICPFLLKEPITSTVIFWRYQSEQMHFNTLNNPQWSARRILSDEVRGHTQMCLPLACVPSLGGGRLYDLRPNPGNRLGAVGITTLLVCKSSYLYAHTVGNLERICGGKKSIAIKEVFKHGLLKECQELGFECWQMRVTAGEFFCFCSFKFYWRIKCLASVGEFDSKIFFLSMAFEFI